MLILNISLVLLPVVDGGKLEDLLMYLTLWGVHVTWFSFAMSIFASFHHDPTKDIFNYKAMANLSINAAEVMEFIITIVAWTLILPTLWQKKGAWST